LCCERPREAVFIDCGHIYSCMKCAMGLTQCPLDKKPIKYFLKFQINDWRGKNQTFLPQIKNNYIDNSNMTISRSYLNSIKNQLDLSEQYTLLKEENVLYQKFYKCLICNKRKKDVMFADCCHLVCCNECSFGFRKCPIDNIEITKRYTIYFA